MLDKQTCTHRYLSPQRRCHECGMQFRVVYEEARFGLWRPAFAAVLFGMGTLLLTALAFVNDLGIFRALLVGLTVFWLVRAMMATADMFVPRQFRVGELGPIGPRGVLSIFAVKPLIAPVAGYRFQFDLRLRERLNEGDVVLVEFMRWTKLPAIWYRGT